MRGIFKTLIADVIILETPTPSSHKTSAYGKPLPPKKVPTYFMDGPIVVFLNMLAVLNYCQKSYCHKHIL